MFTFCRLPSIYFLHNSNQRITTGVYLIFIYYTLYNTAHTNIIIRDKILHGCIGLPQSLNDKPSYQLQIKNDWTGRYARLAKPLNVSHRSGCLYPSYDVLNLLPSHGHVVLNNFYVDSSTWRSKSAVGWLIHRVASSATRQ